jgi:nickel-dependent lactate racemase
LETKYEITIKGMGEQKEIANSNQYLLNSFEHSINSDSLFNIAKAKRESNPEKHAVIVVSDNTRPIPYKGENGIISPIIRILISAGYTENEILILIATGSHREMNLQEIENMLGLKQSGFQKVRVENHIYSELHNQEYLGITKVGTQVYINKNYFNAGLKIVTGLIESHFMAGASGGPKGICPGIVGKPTLESFHGPVLLSSEFSTDLEIERNPIHAEANVIALMAGCDFLVNVSINSEKKITGVFCGELISAHQQGINFIKNYVTFNIPELYDIVLIPAGFVGVNHYQCAKAAAIASKAVKPGGIIIMVAKNTDIDPIGGESYKKVLSILKNKGNKNFMETILSEKWVFRQEQWQVQLWCKVFEIIKSQENLIYCALEIEDSYYDRIPCTPGIRLMNAKNTSISDLINFSLVSAIERSGDNGQIKPTILFLKDGPYGIPIVEK